MQLIYQKPTKIIKRIFLAQKEKKSKRVSWNPQRRRSLNLQQNKSKSLFMI